MTITPAGQRRNLIQILQRSAGQDAAGQPLQTWTTFATEYARIVSHGGSELFKAQQFNPEVTHLVYMPWIDGLVPTTMAILTPDGIYLDILYVNYGERRLDDTVITCKQRIGVNNPT
jgi:head-tail adaptor